jgi:hypothetical protein
MEMTLTCPTTCDASVLKVTAPSNRLPPRKNSHFDSTNHDILGVLTLIRHPDRFPRRKNSSNGGNNRRRHPDDRLRPGRAKPRRNGRTMTTNQLFWPNERRRTAFPLPIRLPNPSFLASKRNGRARRGGGGQPDAADQTAVSIVWRRKFTAKGSLPRHHEYSSN